MFDKEAYWVDPLYHGYKVNVDGATANSQSSKVGVIIRDSTCQVETTMSKKGFLFLRDLWNPKPKHLRRESSLLGMWG